MQIASDLPHTTEALAHGELFLWNIAGRALAIGHGFRRKGRVVWVCGEKLCGIESKSRANMILWLSYGIY